ncbi:MAG: hypothetical protein KDK08_26070 [Rhizobiaceae bacterium]|nr:hypothetical protein [Rhizobiaceae bacterium]
MTAIRSRIRLNLPEELHRFIRSESVLAETTQHAVIVAIIRAARDARHREAL